MQIFLVLCILCLIVNILNSVYISKCKSKLEIYFHAILPSLICTANGAFVFFLINIFKFNVMAINPINIIFNIILCIIFFIVNAFIIVSNGIKNNNDNEVTIGLLFIFCLPIIAIISVPVDIALYFIIKLRKCKDSVKVIEEEMFDTLISANDYLVK